MEILNDKTFQRQFKWYTCVVREVVKEEYQRKEDKK